MDVPRAMVRPGGAEAVVPVDKKHGRDPAIGGQRVNGDRGGTKRPNFKLFRKSARQQGASAMGARVVAVAPWVPKAVSLAEAFCSQPLDGDSQSQLPPVVGFF